MVQQYGKFLVIRAPSAIELDGFDQMQRCEVLLCSLSNLRTQTLHFLQPRWERSGSTQSFKQWLLRLKVERDILVAQIGVPACALAGIAGRGWLSRNRRYATGSPPNPISLWLSYNFDWSNKASRSRSGRSGIS